MKNNQQPNSGYAACENQGPTMKNCLQDCPEWRVSRIKYNIQDTTRKGLLSEEDKEVSHGNRNV